MKVITGGQTGVDIVATQVAHTIRLRTGGYTLRFPHLSDEELQRYNFEIYTDGRDMRGKLLGCNYANLLQANFLLAFLASGSQGGTTGTIRLARGWTWSGLKLPEPIPYMVIENFSQDDLDSLYQRLQGVKNLMICGPRSLNPRQERILRRFLTTLFTHLKENNQE